MKLQCFWMDWIISLVHLDLLFVRKTSNTTLQRPAARYDALGKIGGGYSSLVSMFSRFVSRCPWLPKFGWVPNKGALSNLLESLVE